MNLLNEYLFSAYYIKRNIKMNHFGYILKENTMW